MFQMGRNRCSVTLMKTSKIRHSERILKVKSYLDLYNWKGLDFPSDSQTDR